jgi:hypothetical protein
MDPNEVHVFSGGRGWRSQELLERDYPPSVIEQQRHIPYEYWNLWRTWNHML